MSAALPVLVVGSGSTGLALAQGLRSADVPCIVFEKHGSHNRQRDWNMGLHWSAPVLRSLMPPHWWDRIQSLQVDPHVPTNDLDTLTFLQGDTGKPLAAFTFGPFYRLRRSKLRDLLSEGLDVRHGKRLVNISYATDQQSVTAHFADGSAVTGSLLVGADGARSDTRQILLGPDAGTINRLPYAATFVQSRFTKEQALHLRQFHPLFIGSAHPENNFAFFGMQNAADRDDPSSWTFFFYISWPSSLEEQEATKTWTVAERLAQQKDFAKRFCDPWKSAYEWVSDSASVWYLGLTEWNPALEGHRWDNHGGLVTMVGDAVHPMTYQRAQGLNHAIADAGKLRDALVQIRQGSNQSEVIAAFEDEMIGRGGIEVSDGTKNTMLLHDWERIKQSPLFTKGMQSNVTQSST